MSYAKALEKLESLPPDEQELASGMYVFEVRNGKPHCGCAIGKLLTEEERAELVKCSSNKGGVRSLMEWRKGELPADMGWTESYELQRINDRSHGEHNDDSSRKRRYVQVIDWLRARVAEERPPVGP